MLQAIHGDVCCEVVDAVERFVQCLRQRLRRGHPDLDDARFVDAGDADTLGRIVGDLLVRTGSAMGANKEDFEFTVLDVAEEIRDEHQGFEELEVTVDRVGAQMVLNQNSREPVTEPEEMGPLWKVLHKVGADWTYPSVMWAGENYCMFMADEEGWRYILEEFVYHIDNTLKCKMVVNTE